MNSSAKQTRAYPPEFTVELGDSSATFHGADGEKLANEYAAIKNTPAPETEPVK